MPLNSNLNDPLQTIAEGQGKEADIDESELGSEEEKIKKENQKRKRPQRNAEKKHAKNVIEGQNSKKKVKSEGILKTSSSTMKDELKSLLIKNP